MYISELMGVSMCSEGEEIDIRSVAGFVYTHAACNRQALPDYKWTVRYYDMNIYFVVLNKMRISCIGNIV